MFVVSGGAASACKARTPHVLCMIVEVRAIRTPFG
jgi:hypothetical protein